MPEVPKRLSNFEPRPALTAFRSLFPLEILELIVDLATTKTAATFCLASFACLQTFGPRLYRHVSISSNVSSRIYSLFAARDRVDVSQPRISIDAIGPDAFRLKNLTVSTSHRNRVYTLGSNPPFPSFRSERSTSQPKPWKISTPPSSQPPGSGPPPKRLSTWRSSPFV
jgi:hypothetical protein